MPTLARCALLSLPLVLTAGTALGDAAQDCKNATLTAGERQTACRTAVAEAASYTELARTHLNAGHPEDGLVAAKRAMEIAALLTLGSPEEARAAANRIVDLGPRYEPAQGLLLQALAETGAVDEAMAAYSEAQAIGIKDTGGHLADGLAWGLYKTGEHEKALPIIEEWIAAHPEPMGDPFYHLTLDTAAHILAALGRADEAVDMFLRAAEIGGTGWRVLYKSQLTSLGFAPEPDNDEGFEAALRACVATGEACRLY